MGGGRKCLNVLPLPTCPGEPSPSTETDSQSHYACIFLNSSINSLIEVNG